MDREPDLHLTRLVARHFKDLQGLRSAVMGLAQMLASSVWITYGHEGPPVMRDLVFMFMIAGLSFVSYPIHRLDVYYANRFGRAEQSDKSHRLALVLTVASLVFLNQSAATGMAAIWLTWAAYPLWLAVDGWPYRKHMLVVVAALVGPSALALHGTVDPGFGFLALGLSSVIAGVADHRLLARAMNCGHAEEPLTAR
jgi:hypothetical protein